MNCEYDIGSTQYLQQLSIRVDFDDTSLSSFFFLALCHLIPHYMRGDTETRHKRHVEPRSNGNLRFEGLGADTVLKMIDLQTAIRESTFGIN
jgi:hypothetical protein